MARNQSPDSRPDQIHKLILAGNTLEEIGGTLNLTRERVRQLHKKSALLAQTVTRVENLISEGLSSNEIAGLLSSSSRGIERALISLKRHDLVQQLSDIDSKNKEKLAKQLELWIRSHLGITPLELSAAFEMTLDNLYLLLDPSMKMLMLQTDEDGEFVLLHGEERHISTTSVIFTKESTLRGIAKASEHESPLSSTTYSKLVSNGTIFGPSVPRILQIFGSWRRACELAGVEALQPARKNYEKNWTEDDMIEWAIKFIRATGLASFHEYEPWARRTEGAPSGSTLRNYTGNDWISVRREALRRCRHSWEDRRT
jgi:DNA-binding CsgD family transcriptional regulator